MLMDTNKEIETDKQDIDEEKADNHGITLQGVLTMDDLCLDNTSIAYNSTIIFFKKAAKHKNVEVSNDGVGTN